MNLIEKKDVLKLYNLPKKVAFCKKCTISNQRPRITFDKYGVCSGCNFSEQKKKEINWKKRDEELQKLCDRFRKNDGSFDVVVPCSGGKDGSFVAYQLKHKYGMNPLAVTWAPLQYSEVGKKNLESFKQSGYSHILGSPNPIVTKKLTELTFKLMGDPFQPFIYGQCNFPLSIAVDYNISLIMYGENGEVEYGGDMKYANSALVDPSYKSNIHFSYFGPELLEKYGVSKKDLKFFQGPSKEQLEKNKTELHYLSYYKYWDPQENYYSAVVNCGFSPSHERSEGTYSKYASLDDELDGFHYYLSYVKFGIGRATSDSAHEIRDTKITRDEGITLVKKYDHEFPKKYYQKFLDYCSITNSEFNMILDSWRSDHIWYKDNSNEWKLKNTIWQ